GRRPDHGRPEREVRLSRKAGRAGAPPDGGVAEPRRARAEPLHGGRRRFVHELDDGVGRAGAEHHDPARQRGRPGVPRRVSLRGDVPAPVPPRSARVRWRLPWFLAAATLLASATAWFATGASASGSGDADIVKEACALPREQLIRIDRGTRLDRSGELQIVPKQPNYVAGGYSHAGPWNYLQRVPVFWYGPGVIPATGRVNPQVTSADIAPTEARILGFNRFHPPDGVPMPDVSARPGPPPRLLVTLVWDAGGLDVLNTWDKEWPYLHSLIPDGVWFDQATAGSSPSNTPPIHATIGTGAYPNSNGMLDEYVRVGNIEKPNDHGPAFLLQPTLADLYDRAMGNRPVA